MIIESLNPISDMGHISKVKYCIFLLIFVCSCNTDADCENYAYIEPESVSQYAGRAQSRFENLKGDVSLIIHFINQPCPVQSGAEEIIVYLNHNVVFKGVYRQDLRLSFPSLKDFELCQLSIEFIGNERIYILSDKTNFYWSDKISRINVDDSNDTIFDIEGDHKPK